MNRKPSLWLLTLLILLASSFDVQAQKVVDLTLDDFKGLKFADVLKDSEKNINQCLSMENLDQTPDFGNSEKDMEYKIFLYVSKTHSCDNPNWSTFTKRKCLRHLAFYIKTQDDFQHYLKFAKEIDAPDHLAVIAEMIFYQNSSTCSKFDADGRSRDQVRYAICKALTSPEGVSACLDSFPDGSAYHEYCVEGYTLANAVKTHNINECQKISIRDDMLRLECQILLTDPEDVESKIVAHYKRNLCYKNNAIKLAVVGTLDPDGPRHPNAYCDKLKEFHAVEYRRCQELSEEARNYLQSLSDKN